MTFTTDERGMIHDKKGVLIAQVVMPDPRVSPRRFAHFIAHALNDLERRRLKYAAEHAKKQPAADTSICRLIAAMKAPEAG